MGAYNHNVVVVMPVVDAYIHGVLILCGVPIFAWVLINAMWLIFMGCLFCVGAYYPDFTVVRHTNTCTRNCR